MGLTKADSGITGSLMPSANAPQVIENETSTTFKPP